MENKVFGIGMAKTGTCSLAKAMSILGYRSGHYLSPEEFANIGYYDFACDMPITTRYKVLDVRYHGSKFILTLRSAMQWSRSVSKWISDDVGGYPGEYRMEQFGAKQYNLNPHCFKNRYIEHTIEVLKYFRSRPFDLLVMDICGGDGWEVLCGFLGKDRPDVPFPH